MRSATAVLALLVLVLTGCSDGDEADATDDPPKVSLTGEERDAFIDQVQGLDYTCRAALPGTEEYVGCTRPGAYPDATYDAIQLTSSPDGADVLRVYYCGPEPAVVDAISTSFLGEADSPSLLPKVPDVSGVTLTGCESQVGSGVVLGGPGVDTLREIDVDDLVGRLTSSGYECASDFDCVLEKDDQRVVVSGTDSGFQVSAESSESLVNAARDLGLGQVVQNAAGSCTSDEVCEHLLVDGYDVFVSAQQERFQLRVGEKKDF